MNKKLVIVILILVLLSNIVSGVFTGQNKLSNNYKLQTNNLETYQNTTFSIVTTQLFLQDFTQHIVGNLFKVTSIVKGTEDPHSYTPKPSDVATINSANIFISFGVADIDGWANTVIQANSTSTHFIQVVNLTKDGVFDPYIGVGELNPHLWMSPTFVNSTILERIYNALIIIDPIHTQEFTQNLINYRSELGKLIERIKGNQTDFENLDVVEYHAAFFYLLRDLNITRLGAIEKIENQEPPALHIANITKIIKTDVESGKDVILIQSLNLANEITWQVARDTGAKISYLVALMGNYPNQNFSSYITMIDYDIEALLHPVSAPNPSLPSFDFIPFILAILVIKLIKFKKKILSS